jgi:hypothetical protein
MREEAAGMDVASGQRGNADGKATEGSRIFADKTKKEEFPGITETCRLGTPFPRSALFLEIELWISG